MNILREPAQVSRVLGLTVRVSRARDGRCDLELYKYADAGKPVMLSRITADNARQAVQWAERYVSPEASLVGMVVREGRAARLGEVQHGRHVIMVPDGMNLRDLCATWCSPERPAEDGDMEHDPVPEVTLAQAFEVLASGRTAPLSGDPLHQAYLGASDQARYFRHGDELVIIDCQEGEGLSLHVYNEAQGAAWRLPLDGTTPEVL